MLKHKKILILVIILVIIIAGIVLTTLKGLNFRINVW